MRGHGARLIGLLVSALGLAVLLGVIGAAGPARARVRAGARADPGGTRLPGTACPAFPSDNVWNTAISGLPVDPRSAAWLTHMAAGSTFLHPDYGPAGGGARPYGISWQVTRRPRFVRVRFRYAGESDRGPYPFSARTPIEGGPNATGDRHALMVDPAT